MAHTAPTASDLTDEQREIQALAREFARAEIRPIAAEVDERDTYCPIDVVYRAAEVGLTSFMLPEAVGGGGITDVLTGCIVQEELNWGCAGIGNLITSGGFFARPVVEVGTPEQQERWLGPLCTDRPPLTALASTEPGVGSDAAAMTTAAVRTESGYQMNGQKTWISNGGRLPPGRHGHADRRRPPPHPPGGADDGRRRACPGGSCDGQALRIRDRHVEHLGRRADAGRLGLLPRVSRGEVDAGREARGDRGGHVGHPAADHLPSAARRLTYPAGVR